MPKYNFIDGTTGETLGTIDYNNGDDKEMIKTLKQIFKFRVENGVVSIDRPFATTNGQKPKDQNLFQHDAEFATYTQEQLEMAAAYVLIETHGLFNILVEEVAE